MHTWVPSLCLRSSGASRAGAILLLALPPVAAGLMAAGATPASAASPQSAASDEVLVHYRGDPGEQRVSVDRKSTRLNSSHLVISYAVFCLKKKKRHAE